mmetsp:Transcript_27777/g.54556  ORF Transcript_27777/g.54556 Transcript_27777/m.54556 type:complete len:271 (+) Transcript_27777:87-899(+)
MEGGHGYSTVSEEQTEQKVPDPPDHQMTWGPGYALIIFDVIFFLNYVIGWFVTWAFNHEAIDNNNVTRIFAVYNICIGVDVFPARYVAACIWPIAFMFFGLSVYLHWAKIHFDKRVQKWLGYPLLALSLMLVSCFSLTYAVPPKGVRDTKIHVASFVLGLIGYALLKVYAIVEYAHFVGFKSTEWKDQVYVGSFILQVFFMMFMCNVLLSAILLTDFEEAIGDETEVPKTINTDYKGWVLVFLAAVGPPLQYKFANPELKQTIDIIDATP